MDNMEKLFFIFNQSNYAREIFLSEKNSKILDQKMKSSQKRVKKGNFYRQYEYWSVRSSLVVIKIKNLINPLFLSTKQCKKYDKRKE